MKQLKIGRALNCDIIIDDNGISREHAEIFQDDQGNVFITDLDSSNGTFINGTRLIGSEVLAYNDIVKIGNSVLPWRNYLKDEVEHADEIVAEEIPTTDEIEKNVVEEDITIRNNIILFIVSGVVGIAVLYFLPQIQNVEINWFNYILVFALLGFVGLISLLLLFSIMRILKIGKSYLHGFIVVIAVYVVGGLSFADSIYSDSDSQTNSTYEEDSAIDSDSQTNSDYEENSDGSTYSTESSSYDDAPEGYKRGADCNSCDGTGYLTTNGINYEIGDVCASCNAKGYHWIKK